MPGKKINRMQISSTKKSRKKKEPHNVEMSRVIEQRFRNRLFIEANWNGCICAATSISKTFPFLSFFPPFFSSEKTMKLPPPDMTRKAFYHGRLSKQNMFSVCGAGVLRSRREGRRLWKRILSGVTAFARRCLWMQPVKRVYGYSSLHQRTNKVLT